VSEPMSRVLFISHTLSPLEVVALTMSRAPTPSKSPSSRPVLVKSTTTDSDSMDSVSTLPSSVGTQVCVYESVCQCVSLCLSTP